MDLEWVKRIIEYEVRRKAEFLVMKGENMYPEYDDFYEPSEGEMFFDEMKEKFREILREDVNSEIRKCRIKTES